MWVSRKDGGWRGREITFGAATVDEFANRVGGYPRTSEDIIQFHNTSAVVLIFRESERLLGLLPAGFPVEGKSRTAVDNAGEQRGHDKGTRETHGIGMLHSGVYR